jgi:hypothetical protein
MTTPLASCSNMTAEDTHSNVAKAETRAPQAAMPCKQINPEMQAHHTHGVQDKSHTELHNQPQPPHSSLARLDQITPQKQQDSI